MFNKLLISILIFSSVRVFHESLHFLLVILTFFSSQRDNFTKTQQLIGFQGLFKGTNHIAGK